MGKRIDKDGKKQSTMGDHFKGQKYSSLKKGALKKGELFQDSLFPPNNKSLFYSKVDKDIEWKRPGELCKVPKLVVDGVTNDDLNEGELGNSWFVSACTALAKEPKLFNKVIPDVAKQEWNEEKNEYAGIFRFQFWRYGRWLEVVVDDLLPTKNGRLVFCHSHSRNEFWSALLEKAYAKLYGDYESLEQGFTADALVDFTGGVPEKLILKDMNLSNKDNKLALFTTLMGAHENKALINCCIAGKPPKPKPSPAPAEMPSLEPRPTPQADSVAPPPAVIYDEPTKDKRSKSRAGRSPAQVVPVIDVSNMDAEGSDSSDEENSDGSGKKSNGKATEERKPRAAFRKKDDSDDESSSDESDSSESERSTSRAKTADPNSNNNNNTNNNNNKGDASQGLVKGHGYIMSDLRQIKVAKGLQAKLGSPTLELVRLRNPWGTKEWTGAWSDDSPEWGSLSLKDRQKMGIVFQQEGEFWMSFNDFCTHFTNVDVCHFVNTSFFSLKKSWTESMLNGEWIDGAKGSSKDRAGGSDQGDTYLDNPQYLVDVTADQDTMMMSLEQDDMSSNKGVGEEHKTIGIMIFKTEENRKFRMQIPGEKVSVSEYKQSRSVFHKVVLPRGRYVIIPSTFKAGETCEFLLRVYTGGNSGKPLLKDYPTGGMCSSPYAMVTRLDVQKVVGVQKKEGVKTMDAYVIVKCEGESVKCQPVKDSDSPVWELKCIFYRKKPAEKPITFEIYNSNMIKDDMVGMAVLEDIGSEEGKVIEFDLYGKGKEAKGKEKELQKPGKLFVEVKSSDDLTAY